MATTNHYAWIDFHITDDDSVHFDYVWELNAFEEKGNTPHVTLLKWLCAT